MKIQTILEDLVPVKVKSVDLSKRNIQLPVRTSEKTNTPSSGHYSTGKEDRDEHLYNKISRSHNRQIDDPYWDYVELCIKHQDSNPFFPRIYEYKRYKDKDGSEIPKVKLEKLNKFPDIEDNFKLYAAALNNITGKYEFDGSDDIWGPSQLVGTIQDIIEGHEYTKNEYMEEYAYLVRNLVQNLRANKTVRYDLHMGNIMYRGSSHGVQVVITDPLAGQVNNQ